jgi:phage regulator Rha-like protein
MKELVQMIDGKAVTTSRKVAEVFEKQHKHAARFTICIVPVVSVR